MGRAKFSTSNSFKGKRKRRYTKSAVIASREPKATKISASVARPHAEPVEQTSSTCPKKMSYFGLEVNPKDILKKKKMPIVCVKKTMFSF